jgi:hypothetical protein
VWLFRPELFSLHRFQNGQQWNDPLWKDRVSLSTQHLNSKIGFWNKLTKRAFRQLQNVTRLYEKSKFYISQDAVRGQVVSLEI